MTVLGPLEIDAERLDGYDITDHMTDRAASYPIDTRARLRDTVLELVNSLQPATTSTIRDFEELANFRADDTGKAVLFCNRCGRERVHTTRSGIYYCPCGGAR